MAAVGDEPCAAPPGARRKALAPASSGRGVENARAPDLDGRTVIVTGANSGIGKDTVGALAGMGARVIMACRSLERGEAARQEILAGRRQAAGGGAVRQDGRGAVWQDRGDVMQDASSRLEVMALDLASLDSVRAFAAAFNKKHARLHVLVNNAGVYKFRRRETRDRFELTFGVNHLGHFLLTHLLLGALKEAAAADGEARVVTVASKMHRYGRIDFEDLQKKRRYNGVRAYSDSKLANVLFAGELSRRLAGTGVASNSLHPGVAFTGIYRDLPKWMQAGMRPFMDPTPTIARTTIHLASSPDVAGITDRYFAREKEAMPAPRAQDRDVARRLWDESARLVGI